MLPEKIEFPLKVENSTLEGLKDNVKLDRKDLRDRGDHHDR